MSGTPPEWCACRAARPPCRLSAPMRPLPSSTKHVPWLCSPRRLLSLRLEKFFDSFERLGVRQIVDFAEARRNPQLTYLRASVSTSLRPGPPLRLSTPSRSLPPAVSAQKQLRLHWRFAPCFAPNQPPTVVVQRHAPVPRVGVR